MKNSNVLITNILILAVGIIFLLVFHRESVMEWVVVLSGALFAITGAVNLVVLSREKRRVDAGQPGTGAAGRSMGWLSAAGAIILGVIMIITPAIFVSMFVYIFAVILFLGGCYHIYLLSGGLKPAKMPGWLYILPIVLIVGSAYMFFQGFNLPHESAHIVLLMCGIGLIIYAVTSFIELIVVAAKGKEAKA